VGIWSWLRRRCRGWIGQDQPHRQLLRLLRRAQVRHLLELGISDAVRTQAVLQQLARATGGTIHYTAVDPFELRPRHPLPLRQAYTQLKLPGVEVHLLPGPWAAALQRLVLSGTRVDAVVISSRVEEACLPQLLGLLPRLLRQGVVWREVEDEEGHVRFVCQSLDLPQQRPLAA